MRLTVTNNLGCVSTAVAYPLALATAAARALQAQLGVFPNPAGNAGGGTVTVRLGGLPAQPPVPAELLNTLGQAVRRESWQASQLSKGAALDVSSLAAGVYTLRLRTTDGVLVKRLVVE